MTSATPKERLLEAVVDVALAGGIAGKSLRAIAEAAGTSHRMLIYHFGSREGLFVEVIRAVEARQRAILDELGAEPGKLSRGAGRPLLEAPAQLRTGRQGEADHLHKDPEGRANAPVADGGGNDKRPTAG